MDKETLKYNMEHLGKFDQAILLKGFITANEDNIKYLASLVYKENGDFKPYPGEDKGDIERLEYLAKRGTALKAILHEVENFASCEDFTGMEHLKDLVQEYLKSSKSDDLGENRKAFCVARAKLVQSVLELVELRNWRFQDELQEAKIKALIEFLPS